LKSSARSLKFACAVFVVGCTSSLGSVHRDAGGGGGDDGGGGGGNEAYDGVVLIERGQIHVRLDSQVEPCACDFDYDVDEALGERCETFTDAEISACAAECADPCVDEVSVEVAGVPQGSASPEALNGFARLPITAQDGDAVVITVDGCHGMVEIPVIAPIMRPDVTANANLGGDQVDFSWNPDGDDRACGVIDTGTSVHYCCSRDDGDLSVTGVAAAGYTARLEQFWDLGSWTEGDSRAGLWELVRTTVP